MALHPAPVAAPPERAVATRREIAARLLAPDGRCEQAPADAGRVAARPHRSVRTRLRAPFGDHLYRNAAALVVNTGATSVLGLLYWAVAARLYPAGEVGRASAQISAMTLCSGVAQLNMLQGLPRFVPVAGTQTGDLVRRAYRVCLWLALAVAVVALSGGRLTGWGGAYLGTGVVGAAWFVAAVVAWTAFTLQDAALIGLRRSVWLPVENITFGVAKVALLVGAASVSTRHGIFASYTVPVALSLVPVSWVLFRRFIPLHEAAAGGRGLATSWGAVRSHVATDYVGTLAYLASMTGLPLVVAALAGLEDTAYFSTTWLLGVSLDLVLSGVTTALLVEGAGDPARLGALVRKLLGLCVVTVLPVLAALALAAPAVLGVLGADYASEASSLLRFLTLAMAARVVTLTAFACWRVQHRVRLVVAVQWGLASTVLVLAAVAARSGITGVGAAFAAAQVVAAVVCLPTVVGVAGSRAVDGARARAWWRAHGVEATLLGAASVLGVAGAARIEPAAVGDAGLVQAVGPLWVGALVAVAGAFVVAVRRRRPSTVVLGGSVAALVLLLHGTAPFVEPHPRFFSAYLHAGFAEVVARTGGFLPFLDARFSWPSTFALAALISDAGGEDVALWLVRWAPVVFTFAYLGPLWLLARACGADRRAGWITLVCFVTTNWYGQDYLSPQAFGLLCYLVVLAIAIGPFGSPGRDRRPGGAGRRWSILAVLRRDDASTAVAAPLSPGVERGLFALGVGLVLVVTASHQLTPVVLVAALAALSCTRRTRLTTLWVFAAVAFAGWFSFGAAAFWTGHLDLVTGGVGQVGANVSSGLAERAGAVTPERQLMLWVRIGLTLTTIGLAGLGWLRSWWRRSFALAPALLAAAPFGVVGLQSYGGEAVLRSGVFAAPFLAIGVARLVSPGPAGEPASRGAAPAGPRWVRRPARSSPVGPIGPVARTALAWAALVLAGSALVTARFGNESFEAVADDERDAVAWLYDHAPVGSTLISVSRNLPWRYQDLERYRYEPSGDEVYGDLSQLSGIIEPLRRGAHEAYVVLSPAQELFSVALYGARPGWMGELRAEIDACDAFVAVYRRGEAAVYRVDEPARVDACIGGLAP